MPRQSRVALERTEGAPTDLARLESLLAQILERLRQPQPAVRVEGDVRAGGSVFILAGQGSGEVRVTREEADQLGLLQRADDPNRREEIYLARFFLSETYAQWDRYYLPLAGHLLEAPLRLTDRGDQGMSAAGLPLKDVRQALTGHQKTRLVVLGEPGAGKTTTLHRLALDLARERLRDPLRGKLPVRADLFKFTGDSLQPAEFLKSQWETTGLSESYGEALARGQVCFLLDGVNQMPLADRAKRIECWAHWANNDAELPTGNWAVFTCRAADYVTDLRLPEVHVQSLDPERMRRFFELRFGPERASELWRDFETRLRSGDDRFEKLARNPFMLSLLADRCDEGKPLADSQAALMDDLANRLLEHELREGRQPETLTVDPRRTLLAARDALSRLAFAMQAHGEGTGLTRALAESVLSVGQTLTPDQALKLASDATVLEKTDIIVKGKTEEGHAFYHHLLQEYFAAQELLRQFRAGKNCVKHWRVPWRAWQFMPKRLAPGERLPPPPVTGWEETVIMAAGLAGPDAPRFSASVKKDNLPLAGRCLSEAGTERAELSELGKKTRADLLTRQRGLSGLGRAHLRARIDAGLALGELGHPDLQPQKFDFEGRTVWAIVPPLQPVPTESEWEKAARGSDGHEYPWGEKFDSTRCNTVESHIYTTTPVGLYPNGTSPCGMFDASGNVWEWTADWYQMYPGGDPSADFGEKFRAVRGGSWADGGRVARCAYRFRFVPGDFDAYLGFRVVSPGSYF